MKTDVTYKDRAYRLVNGNWVDGSYMEVPLAVRTELDEAYAQTLSTEAMSAEELTDYGDLFKAHGSYGLAIQFYETALLTAPFALRNGIFPRLTSCYRALGKHQKAIALMEEIQRNDGQKAITPALLTSIAGAYCSIKDYRSAWQYADRAFAASGGKTSEELRLVYRKLQKESPRS